MVVSSKSSVRMSWQMQLASVLQILAGNPPDAAHVHLREAAGTLLREVGEPVNDTERMVAQGMLLEFALNRLGLRLTHVLWTSLGHEAVRLIRSDPADQFAAEACCAAHQARDIIDREFSHRVTVTSLSRRLHIHRNQLSAEFRRHYGCSIPAYISLRRILYAATLLQDDRMATNDIANSVGYSSKTHFCRQFRLIMGMTPGQFRSTITTNVQIGPSMCSEGVVPRSPVV